MIKVENLESPRSGRKVANQFVIYAPGETYFQSYSTVIARKVLSTGQIWLDNDYNYSKTTMRYLGQFLRESAKEIHKKVKSGEYQIVDLN